ncbi:hypothetical protein CCYA_CCYA02G0682 [Cyanidiococcus yangmingshanensis]|nr:hypothetical protein CCYA_CCYA02G0682 [Cyanidiococcus yangmingshanensis]
MSDAVGIMSGAFFVSRGELLSWLNDFLKLSYTKVEQVADGSAHCQVFDALFPGKVPLHKVNFGARHEYEFVQNYKVLQAVLDKVGIEKHIEVERLIKARAQDNLEFLQWVKAVFDRFYAGQPYNAIERREAATRKYQEQKAGFVGNSIGVATKRRPITNGKPAPGLSAPATRTVQRAAVNGVPVSAHADSNAQVFRGNSNQNAVGALSRSAANAPLNQPREGLNSPGAPMATSATANAPAPEAYQALVGKVTEMQLAIDNLEKERTYYFEKLRDIELLCQTHPEPELPLIKAIQAVLYDEPINVDGEESALGSLPASSSLFELDPTAAGAPRQDAASRYPLGANTDSAYAQTERNSATTTPYTP